MEQEFSDDSIIKELIRDYPVDALEFIEPAIIRSRGKPVSVRFLMQENKKHRHSDTARHHDIAVQYTFADSSTEILVLIEHWSDKAKFDIYRLAHYVLDLGARFPHAEILPVALFLDKANTWRKNPEERITIRCGEKCILSFELTLIRLKAYEAQDYISTRNKFLAVLAPAMHMSKENKVDLGLEMLKNFRYTETDVRLYEKNLAALEHFLAFSKEEYEQACARAEQEENMTLAEHFTEKGKIEGKIEGAKQARLEDAQKMLADGMDISLIEKYTGLSRDEIEALKR